MENRFIIQALLLIAILAIALIIVWPGGGARRLALRRIGLLAVALAAAASVVFPDLTNAVASLLGVGRGADLLLYGTVVVFIWNYIATRAHHRRIDVTQTELARSLALSRAPHPDRPGDS